MTRSPSSPETRAENARARPLRLCSVVSEGSGEDPIGSAWSVSRYLLVEMPLPWGYNFLEGEQVPTGFQDLIHAFYSEGKDLGLIGMAPDPDYSVPGVIRVIDLRLPDAPFRRYERHEYLVPLDSLVSSLRLIVDDPATSNLEAFRQPPAQIRDLLVCTHGAVDACCAKFGYPIYRRLRQTANESTDPVRVWRCTHFGGHRFAPTLLDMPEGRYWGRLRERHMSHLIHRDVPMAELRECYRGWAALPHPLLQVAEGEAFVRAGWAWTDCAVTASDAPPPDATQASITFNYQSTAQHERGEIVLDVRAKGTTTTQHACSKADSAELHEVSQYETTILRCAPQGGLLDSHNGS
jgi:hypothetical protein